MKSSLHHHHSSTYAFCRCSLFFAVLFLSWSNKNYNCFANIVTRTATGTPTLSSTAKGIDNHSWINGQIAHSDPRDEDDDDDVKNAADHRKDASSSASYYSGTGAPLDTASNGGSGFSYNVPAPAWNDGLWTNAVDMVGSGVDMIGNGVGDNADKGNITRKLEDLRVISEVGGIMPING